MARAAIATWRPRARWTEALLLLMATAVLAVAWLSLGLNTGQSLEKEFFTRGIGLAGIFLLLHWVLCFTAPRADQFILPATALLNGLGILMITRLDLVNETSRAPRQMVWTLLSAAALFLLLVVVRRHQVLSRYSFVLGAMGLVLLALPLVWPTKANADASLWIEIGPFSVQPGEFAKILLLLFFAQLLVNKRTLFSMAGKRFLGLEFPRLRDLGPLLAVWAVALVIMAGENDFGPALLLFGTVLGMLYLATGRASWLLIGMVLVAIGGTSIYKISAKIQDRVHNFLDPISRYDSSGFQLSEGLFGMNWGGLSGTGLGRGYPQRIPVVESDFILAAFGEELGLIGLCGILVLFALLVTRGFRAAQQAGDSYGTLVAGGLALTLAIQVFVVTGGITALLPMTGLTTPFMSAGGSSLMANYLLLGLLLRISDAAATPTDTAPDVDVRPEVQR